MKQTSIIQSKDIAAKDYLGIWETPSEGIYHAVTLTLINGEKYIVAGGMANAGLIPEYAMEIEFSTDETLQEMFADIEEVEREGNPSGALLAWHGSLCI